MIHSKTGTIPSLDTHRGWLRGSTPHRHAARHWSHFRRHPDRAARHRYIDNLRAPLTATVTATRAANDGPERTAVTLCHPRLIRSPPSSPVTFRSVR